MKKKNCLFCSCRKGEERKTKEKKRVVVVMEEYEFNIHTLCWRGGGRLFAYIIPFSGPKRKAKENATRCHCLFRRFFGDRQSKTFWVTVFCVVESLEAGDPGLHHESALPACFYLRLLVNIYLQSIPGSQNRKTSRGVLRGKPSSSASFHKILYNPLPFPHFSRSRVSTKNSTPAIKFVPWAIF